MNFDEYQQLAMRTDGQKHLGPDERLLYGALAVVGEAGELADYIKKCLFHGHPLDKTKVILEAGDVMWGLAHILQTLETGMAFAAAANIEKLRRRYPDGFSSEASQARVDQCEHRRKKVYKEDGVMNAVCLDCQTSLPVHGEASQLDPED